MTSEESFLTSAPITTERSVRRRYPKRGRDFELVLRNWGIGIWDMGYYFLRFVSNFEGNYISVPLQEKISRFRCAKPRT